MIPYSSSSSFFTLVRNRWNTVNSLLCIGLDPEITKMPRQFQEDTISLTEKIFSFTKSIIDETHDLVCCYKPQAAFYEQYGVEGIQALLNTITYIHTIYPDIPVLLDAKRGDIGSTAEAYAKAVFDIMQADAVTINPYLGHDSVEPFLVRKNKGVIFLTKTSNPGSNDFQNQLIGTTPLYEYIAKTVSTDWNTNNNCGLVVGATHIEELKKIRSIVGNMPLLIPGIGAQGGNIEETVKAGKDEMGSGMLISSSRAILYASPDQDFAKAARSIAKSTKDEINKYRK